jgi:hypothetical protein
MFIFVSFLILHNAFAQNETQKTNIYEGLGLKMKYFDPWKITVNEDDPSCINCSIRLTTPDIEALIAIIQTKFDSPIIKDECKCDTLLEYVRYVYEDIISKDEDLVFINDNQTTLTDDNIPAIVISEAIDSAQSIGFTVVAIQCNFGMNIMDWKCKDHGIYG